MWVKNDGFIKLYGEYNILNHLNFTKPDLLKVIQINSLSSFNNFMLTIKKNKAYHDDHKFGVKQLHSF